MMSVQETRYMGAFALSPKPKEQAPILPRESPSTWSFSDSRGEPWKQGVSSGPKQVALNPKRQGGHSDSTVSAGGHNASVQRGSASPIKNLERTKLSNYTVMKLIDSEPLTNEAVRLAHSQHGGCFCSYLVCLLLLQHCLSHWHCYSTACFTGTATALRLVQSVIRLRAGEADQGRCTLCSARACSNGRRRGPAAVA